MAGNPFANRPRAEAYGFRYGLRRPPACIEFYDPLSTARCRAGILVNVHPVLPRASEVSQPQLPRSEPDGQPVESSLLAFVGLLCRCASHCTLHKSAKET